MAGETDYQSYRFKRRFDWEEGEDGRVIVLRPRLGEGRIGRWLESFWRLSPYRIRLDQVGTLVWKQCDGKTSFREIARQLRGRFGTGVEPAEDRLHQFLVQMHRARMIEAEPDAGERCASPYAAHGPLD